MDTYTELIEQAWERYSRRLGDFIRSRVADEAEAEDILQEVFIRVHRSLCCQAEWNRPDAWIYQIARNLVIDHYRRRRELAEIPENLPAGPDLPEEDPEAELAPSLKEMVDELPEPYRQALILTEYEGLSQEEMAARLQLDLRKATPATTRVADGRVLALRLVTVDGVSVGARRVASLEIGILPHEGESEYYDGLLGFDFLSRFQYQLDVPNQLLRWQ